MKSCETLFLKRPLKGKDIQNKICKACYYFLSCVPLSLPLKATFRPLFFLSIMDSHSYKNKQQYNFITNDFYSSLQDKGTASFLHSLDFGVEFKCIICTNNISIGTDAENVFLAYSRVWC